MTEIVKNLIALAFRISIIIIVFAYLAGKRRVIIPELWNSLLFRFSHYLSWWDSESHLINPFNQRVSSEMRYKTWSRIILRKIWMVKNMHSGKLKTWKAKRFIAFLLAPFALVQFSMNFRLRRMLVVIYPVIFCFSTSSVLYEYLEKQFLLKPSWSRQRYYPLPLCIIVMTWHRSYGGDVVALGRWFLRLR